MRFPRVTRSRSTTSPFYQVGCDDWPDLLLDGYRVASGVMKRSPVGVYEVKIETEVTVLFSGFAHVPSDMPQPIDLLKCPPAGPEEVRDAIAASKELAAKDDNEPAPTKPAAPEYRRINREEDPTSSRLGFTVGATEGRRIQVGGKWTAHGFHLVSAQVIGSIDISLSVSAFCSQRLEIALFDALGNRILSLNLTDNRARFDQVRLSPGDYAIFSSAVSAQDAPAKAATICRTLAY